ncbi:MAG: hypothetical protein H0V66_06455 [Bdellovibrionales bacterium]|nr:hypothetical protein [Bdellovibrionales bacterium]
MKKVIIVMLLLSTQAFAAAKTILTCTTPGDALSALEVVENGAKSVIKIHYMDDSTKVFKLNSSLANIKAGKSDTLVAAVDLDAVYGGSISDAILMRIFPGQKEARLGANSQVYFLNCK